MTTKNTTTEPVTAPNELELLIELTAKEQIGSAMLVRNVLAILDEEPGLLVDTVLQLTDQNRDFGVVALADYRAAYRAVEEAPRVRARQVLLCALQQSANLAGYGELADQAA
ncbi:MAG: hypothetical protein ABGY95_12550 [Rubritalea sp.]|uniref:hypothetical protein n=1 Tax=Rubritalea sp. TaxID=2109375 RepID=UPI003242E5F7